MTAGLFFDRYERGARLVPAILAVLPAAAAVLVWLPKVAGLGKAWGIGGIVWIALMLFGAAFARWRGRAVQGQVLEQTGGWPTTVSLRHRDNRINPVLKGRYHAALRSRGLDVPTAAEEATDPDHADHCYAAAAAWLRDNTRDARAFPLIMSENIGYGFRRNLFGLKPAAIALLLVCVAADAVAVLQWGPIDPTQRWAGILLGLAFVIDLMFWIFAVTPDFVVDASLAYTDRLLAASEVLAQS